MKVGDRVILTNDDFFPDTPFNPIWKGKHSVVGTITKIEEINNIIYVTWDNSINNFYLSKHLTLYDCLMTEINNLLSDI